MSIPTRTYEGSVGKGGLLTTVPPTYISACKSSASTGEFLSKAITRAVQPSCSSAKSRRATILKGRRLGNVMTRTRRIRGKRRT